jgi:cytochrome c oxidase assembly protein subunit 19
MVQPPQRIAPKAPELGSFPLDHFRECKPEIELYYRCLQANQNTVPLCRDQIRAYIQCRMDRGLMTKSDISAFGIPETEFVLSKTHKQDVIHDALRAGAVAAQVPTRWEKFKRQDLEIDDGFERPKEQGTGNNTATSASGNTDAAKKK